MSSARAADGPGDIIRVEDQYYIRADSSLADDRTRVLKQGETFAVFDRYGDLHPVGRGHQGLYHDGTRHLSRLELRIESERPILLSSTVTEENAMVAVDLTNPPLRLADGSALGHDTVHLFRSTVLWQGVCYQRLRVRSYALAPVRLGLTLRFAADFVDIFEVRGLERARRGERLEPEVGRDLVVLAYRGLDGVERRSTLRFAPPPAELRADRARFEMALAPGAEETVFLAVACAGKEGSAGAGVGYEEAARASRAALEARAGRDGRIETSNEQFNDWLQRSTADLATMLSETPHGLYPYAGVPWFSTPFGRDGLVTALETLWIDPGIARAVLRYLAATQATELSEASDAEPGKILHEARGGEMAALGEVPFHRYYGTVDATPLFVLLAHAYFERTGDRELLHELWDPVRRALEWIDTHGDRDGDGFVEYARRAPTGLVNQGWKDSGDAVFHADGSLAEPPIALAEVQAWVFGAKRGASRLAAELGDQEASRSLLAEAEALRRRFEERFWCEELGSYALALDGRKRPCRVRSSNAGQCLFGGIASPERAAVVAATLMREESFSGWGIRTVPDSERRYNPMSYHNGSVWPHDNALIAAGLARYGLRDAAVRVLAGLFDATLFLDLHRLPELFCGFPRRPGEGPTLYPVACAPQAWASAAVFLLLESVLGVHVSALDNRVLFRRPRLPPFLATVRIQGLRVGGSTLDLALRRHPEDVGIEILRREGDAEVIVAK
jgi:glycogen debranching enzyme